MVGERKRKTPEGLSAVDTPPPSLSLLGSFAHAKPRRPFNERNLLFAGSSTCTCYETTRCSAYDSRSGLAPPPPAPSLTLCISSYVDGMLPRPGRSSGLYFATRRFCGLSGKGQPPLCFCLSRPSCWPVACSHVATLGQGELPVQRLDELETLA